MIEQLATNNVINNWNIYENRTGHVCLNIRFDVESGRPGSDGNSQTHKDLMNTQYKKVSPKQQARNMHRVRQHRNTMMTRSQSRAAPENEIEHARCNESDSDSISSISIDTVISETPQGSPQILTPSSHISPQPQSVKSIATNTSCTGLMSPECLDMATQVENPSSDASVQAVPVVPTVNSKVIQTISIKQKSKFTQIVRRSDNICVQAGCSRLYQMDNSAQTSFTRADCGVQVGTGHAQLVDSSQQVKLDLDVVTADKASNVTTDLVEQSDKQIQTPFLCPGYEHDPSFDLFCLNRPCANSECRYAGRHSRLCQGILYRCSWCDIIMCIKCRDETVHDEVCERSLMFHRVVHVPRQ
jgi:hypothetical protein